MKNILIVLLIGLSASIAGAVDNLPAVKINGSLTLPADLTSYFNLSESATVIGLYPKFKRGLALDGETDGTASLLFTQGAVSRAQIWYQEGIGKLNILASGGRDVEYSVEGVGGHHFITGDTGQETFTIKYSSVGIMNTNPSYPLDVTGTIKATSFAIDYEQIMSPCGPTGTCVATCTGNKKVIGGGCYATPMISPLQGYPTGPQTYQCESTVTTSAMTAYAICGNVQ